jgi:hypothetical protein
MQLLRCAANARVYSAALENSKNEEIERLVVRMARENSSWGYDRIWVR